MNAVILATEQISFPLLTALVVLPAIGAIAVALTPRQRPDLAKVIGLLFAVGTLAISIFLLVQFKTHPHLATTGVNGLDHAEGFQFVDPRCGSSSGGSPGTSVWTGSRSGWSS